MEKRQALFQMWYFGFTSVCDGDPDEPSTIAHVLSCMFFQQELPHLRLNEQETAVTDTLSSERCMPNRLRQELEAKLASTATEIGIHKDLLLAVAYGRALPLVGKDKNLTGEGLLRDVVKLLHASLEESLNSADPFRKLPHGRKRKIARELEAK
jgi:hypothetical protein